MENDAHTNGWPETVVSTGKHAFTEPRANGALTDEEIYSWSHRAQAEDGAAFARARHMGRAGYGAAEDVHGRARRGNSCYQNRMGIFKLGAEGCLR